MRRLALKDFTQGPGRGPVASAGVGIEYGYFLGQRDGSPPLTSHAAPLLGAYT